MSAEARNYTHVPFDRMTCPATGCEVEGTVPGVKRHVTRMHPDMKGQVEWPPLRTGENAALEEKVREDGTTLENLNLDDLRAMAKAKGIAPAGMKKDELVAALS